MKVGSFKRSQEMHDETEIPQKLFDKDTLRVIKTRYEFAANYVISKRVLEIGAGPGLGAKYFTDITSEYVPTEYSDENIELFKNNNCEVEIIKADALDLPFDDDSFESIIALAMIYYLDATIFFKECARVLEKGGELIFCSTNKDVPGFIPSPYTVRYYSVQELTQLLDLAGFNVTVFGSFYRPYKSLFITYLRNFIKNIFKKLLFLLPGGYASWKSMRNVSLGSKEKLPNDIRLISEETATLKPINKYKINREYRVVYFVATLR